MQPGSFFGEYRIDRVIGEGAMGTVYLAWDPGLRQHTALKVLLPHLSDKAGVRMRFINEAMTQARLRHENLVWVYRLIEEGNRAGIRHHAATSCCDGLRTFT